jgi:hypothetical protein
VALISKVESAHVYILKLPKPLHELLSINATGEVPTTGWTNLRLTPRYYVTPPRDGLWDFDFVGDRPQGIVGQVVLPVSAHTVTFAPQWFKGVRIHSATNSVEALPARHNPPLILSEPDVAGASPAVAGHVIHRQTIASFDDSIQPTGRTKWDPWPHLEMKKLHHELELVVEGPDEAQIISCIKKAAAAGLIAAIVAAFVTGGAALPAAISAFLTELERCLGNKFSARVDNHSHWVYWWT